MVTIQRLTPDDVDRARALRLRSLRDAPDAYWTTAEEETRTTAAEWRARLTNPAAVTFVARLDGTDVGLVFGAPHHDQAGDAGLYGMWVASEARGTGVGAALIDALVGWARVTGYRHLRLEVADANLPAVRLYERAGFKPTGRAGTLPPPREHITEHERLLQLDQGR